MSALLVYHTSPLKGANNFFEHVDAFKNFSKHKFVALNTFYDFSPKFYEEKFNLIVFHYSLFGAFPFSLSEKLVQYFSKQSGIKVFFFQDEYVLHNERLKLLKKIGVNQIYSLVDETEFKHLYKDPLNIDDVYRTLAGFVNEDVDVKPYLKPHLDRSIDIGYRVRRMPLFLGTVTNQKSEIAEYFTNISEKYNLNIDISLNEKDRIYGKDWVKFLGNCKFTLGAESGSNIFDFDGEISNKFHSGIENEGLSELESYLRYCKKYEGNVNYMIVSPRIFESALMKVCPIMFYGQYNKILEPNKNYIALDTDYSNIKEVIQKMRDLDFIYEIIETNAKELIKSGRYSLQKFIRTFDKNLGKYEDQLPVKDLSYHNQGHFYKAGSFGKKVYTQLRNWDFYGKNKLRSLKKFLIDKAS